MVGKHFLAQRLRGVQEGFRLQMGLEEMEVLREVCETQLIP